jgi:sec-independent protein translocase protein TatA
MGDVAKGVKSFKKGLADDETADAKAINRASTVTVDATEDKSKVSG